MKRHVSRAWLQQTSQDKSIKEAKELDCLMDEMQNELLLFKDYIGLFERTCKHRYKNHGRLRKFLGDLHERTRLSVLTLVKLRETYQNKIADYEHDFGVVPVKKPHHFADFSISIHELLDECSESAIVRRFFDE